MTDKNAIKVISGLLQHAPAAHSKAAGDVDAIIKKYPYFIPARYIKAEQSHSKKAFSSEMLTETYPYRGNWLMFLDHIQGIKKPVVAATVDLVEEISVVEDQVPAEEIEVLVDDSVSPILLMERDEEILLVEEQMPAEVIEEVVPVVVETVVIEEVLVAENDEDLLKEDEIEEVITVTDEEMQPVTVAEMKEEDIFTPMQSEDYFMQQGIKISRDMPDNMDELAVTNEQDTRDKSLMVMMSFTEWLLHFKTTAEKKNSELEDQKAVRTMWQKEKLSAALEEENDEIPENVFEMAVNSIAREEGLASESLADIYMKQGKYDQAIEMYKKLSLRNPQKNAYFARKIEEILKEKRS